MNLPKPQKVPNFQRGFFQLTEVIISIAVIAAIGFLFLKNTDTLSKISKYKNQNTAYHIASTEVDKARSLAGQNFGNLALGTTSKPKSELPNGILTKIIEQVEPDGSISTNDLKKVTIKVSWNDQSETRNVQLVTWVAKEGIVR